MLHWKWFLILEIRGVGSESWLSHSSENCGTQAIRRVGAIFSLSVVYWISQGGGSGKSGQDLWPESSLLLLGPLGDKAAPAPAPAPVPVVLWACCSVLT